MYNKEWGDIIHVTLVPTNTMNRGKPTPSVEEQKPPRNPIKPGVLILKPPLITDKPKPRQKRKPKQVVKPTNQPTIDKMLKRLDNGPTQSIPSPPKQDTPDARAGKGRKVTTRPIIASAGTSSDSQLDCTAARPRPLILLTNLATTASSLDLPSRPDLAPKLEEKKKIQITEIRSLVDDNESDSNRFKISQDSI